MSEQTIVANGPVIDVAREILKPHGEIVIAPDSSDEQVFPLLPEAKGVILRGDGRFSAEALEKSAQLQVIARSGVGYDNVDVAAATARKIPVVFTPGAGARAVAEAAMAWMLSLCKRVSHWDHQFKLGDWESRYALQSGDLEDATLGIVGLGRIGQQLVRLATPFDMKILAYDPYIDQDAAANLGVELVALDELFQQSDFISLHCATTKENRGMVNRELLQKVKPGAFFVNLARGPLVDNLDDLHEALQDGRLAGVGLDVFVVEPPPADFYKHPLFQHPNCLTAPHALAGTSGATRKIFTSMANDMAAVFRGERPKFVVNPEVFD